MTTPTVVLVGTLDTKGIEYGYVRDRLIEQGVSVVLIDTGVLDSPTVTPDVTRDVVARAAGADLQDLIARGDRGEAISTMARGAGEILSKLHA
ncbi:MAG: hypothetical protein QOJ59_1850, partial [Thermomicrobiales bacterium]|nr:hypothetical protein [Thermomicrobiales bacterium]